MVLKIAMLKYRSLMGTAIPIAAGYEDGQRRREISRELDREYFGDED